MTIERRQTDKYVDYALVMTECPFCGEPLRENQGFVNHRPYCDGLDENGDVIRHD
jgi:hypothetical protein